MGRGLARNRAFVAMPIIIPIKDHDWKNASFVHKFGKNPDVDGAVDIWDGARDYVFLSAATTHYISSDTAGDTAIEFKVIGLDTDWNEVTQTVTTDASDGRTFVALATDLIRVYRAYVSGDTAPSGDIYISSDNTDAGGNGIPDDLDDMKAKIIAPNNQTLMSIYPIPASTTGYLFKHGASMTTAAATKTMDVQLQKREFGGVFRVQDENGLSGSGDSHYSELLVVAESFPAKTDIKMRVTAASTVNMSCTSSFTILLLPDSP